LQFLIPMSQRISQRIPQPIPQRIPLTQGAYFLVTGLWPIFHLRSFEAVTGPKQDRWLVKTMGGLIAIVGAALLTGGLERRPSSALRVLGLGSAAALALADCVYAGKRRISPVYLLDAVLEAGLIGAWLSQSRPPGP
jgi:hypothetical protein